MTLELFADSVFTPVNGIAQGVSSSGGDTAYLSFNSAYTNYQHLMQLCFGFCRALTVLLSNYMSLIFFMSYVSLVLSQVAQAYVFAYTRYTYLYFMVLRAPLKFVINNHNGNYLHQHFGVLRFLLALSKTLLFQPKNFLLLALISAYVFFNPLSMLVSALAPSVSAVSFGIVNSCLELAIACFFARGLVDQPVEIFQSVPMRQSVYGSFSSSIAGLVLLLWLVHDEIMLFSPLLSPLLSLMSLSIVQMNIVGFCAYAVVDFIVDLSQSSQLLSLQSTTVQAMALKSQEMAIMQGLAEYPTLKQSASNDVFSYFTGVSL